MITFSSRTPLLAVLAIVFVAGSSYSNDEMASVLVEGYRNSIREIKFARVEYTLRRGTADSIEAAIAGDLSEVQVEAKGRWAIDGNNERRDLVYPPEKSEVLVAEYESGQKGYNFVPIWTVRNDKAIAYCYQTQKNAGLVPVTEAGVMREGGYALFSIGEEIDGLEPRLLTRFRLSVEHPTAVATKYIGVENCPGGTGHHLQFVGQPSDINEHFWIDPDRGFLPIHFEIHEADGSLWRQVVVPEIKSFSNNRWLPMRMVQITGASAPHRVIDIRVTSANLDERPDSSEFELLLPPGTVMSDNIGGKTFRVKGNEPTRFSIAKATAHLGTIPSSPVHNTIPISPVLEKPKDFTWIVVTVCIIVVIGIASVIYRRYSTNV